MGVRLGWLLLGRCPQCVLQFREAGISQLFTEPQDGCGGVAYLGGQGLDAHVRHILAVLIDEFQDIQLIVAQAFDDSVIQVECDHGNLLLIVCVHFITNPS